MLLHPRLLLCMQAPLSSISRICLQVLLSFLLLPSRNLSFRLLFPIPLLHSSFTWHAFPNVRSFEVPLATLSLPGPWRPCSLGGAEMAWRVIRLGAATNLFRDPPSPYVRFFSCRHPMARCRSLHPPPSVFWQFSLRPFFRDLLMHRYGPYLRWGWLVPYSLDRILSLLGRLSSLFAMPPFLLCSPLGLHPFCIHLFLIGDYLGYTLSRSIFFGRGELVFISSLISSRLVLTSANRRAIMFLLP
jgi:hypothetical protein